MDDLHLGTINIAEFISETVGKSGHVQAVGGGCLIASNRNVQNAYFAAAIRTAPDSDPEKFVTDSVSFFGDLHRAFYFWVPTNDLKFRDAVAEVAGDPEASKPPAMSIRTAIEVDEARCTVRAARTADDFTIFGETVEAGYESPGLGWLLSDQESYSANGVTWAIAYDGDDPVGAACGYNKNSVGGVYFVATPPEHRGKRVGAEVTRWTVNSLFENGARCVTLQSSQIGLGVYERLGFDVCGYYEIFLVNAPEG